MKKQPSPNQVESPEHHGDGGASPFGGLEPQPTLTDLALVRARMKEGILIRLDRLARNVLQASIRSSGQLVFVDSDQPSSALNIVFGVPDSIEEVWAITRQYLPRHLPATWWLPTDVATPAAWWLAECGWGIKDVLIGMALKMDDGYEIARPEPSGLVIKPCDSLELARDLALIVGSLFEGERVREGDLIRRTIESHAKIFLRPDPGFRAWVAYFEGTPVSAANLYSFGDSADISRLATRPEFRRRGFGQTVFLHALAEAKAMGAHLVTLQAASQGVRTYTKLGFTPANQFVLWDNQYLL